VKRTLPQRFRYMQKRFTKETLYMKRDLRLHVAVDTVHVGKNREIDVKRDLQKSPMYEEKRPTYRYEKQPTKES